MSKSGHDKDMKKKVHRVIKKTVDIIRAFTLIEILIVIAILGIIGLFSSQIGWSYILRARDTIRKDDLERMRLVIDEAYNTHGHYPTEIPECGFPYIEGSLLYLEEIPCDPKSDISYHYVTDETGQSQWYKLYTNLEYTEDTAIDDVGCRTGCGPNCQYNYGIASSNIDVMGCTQLVPTLIPTPDPLPVLYACAPGGGGEGVCEAFDDPERSECPLAYPDDPTCLGECSEKENKCKNASGKHVPD